MMDPEAKRYIQQEIKRQMNIILNAQVGVNNDSFTETISNLFPGQPDISSRPVMHPFGFVSRAAQGIISVVARVGDHFGNRMVLGHRDSNKPTDLNEGETTIYSLGDYRIKIMNNGIYVSQGTDYEPVVAGQTLLILLTSLIQTIIKHTHEGNLGFETSPPLNNPDFQNLESNFLDNNEILAIDGGRYGS